MIRMCVCAFSLRRESRDRSWGDKPPISDVVLPVTSLTTIVFFKKIIEYTFGSTKELRVVFFYCDWFDPISGTRVDDFGMMEVKHKSHLSSNNIVLAY
jgi:hypothetical protein